MRPTTDGLFAFAAERALPFAETKTHTNALVERVDDATTTTKSGNKIEIQSNDAIIIIHSEISATTRQFP